MCTVLGLCLAQALSRRRKHTSLLSTSFSVALSSKTQAFLAHGQLEQLPADTMTLQEHVFPTIYRSAGGQLVWAGSSHSISLCSASPFLGTGAALGELPGEEVPGREQTHRPRAAGA